MKNIAVIGTGTAGVVSLAHCLAFFTSDWKVTSVYDPNIPMLGIGESTSTQIPTTLFYGTDLNFLQDQDESIIIALEMNDFNLVKTYNSNFWKIQELKIPNYVPTAQQ